MFGHYNSQFLLTQQMNTLTQDQYFRAQRQRKQQIYRQMLDHQIRYKNQAKHEEKMSDYRTPTQPQRGYDNQRHSQQLSLQRPQRPFGGQFRGNRLDNQRMGGEEDRTQIYLANCEQIIRNLRQLKLKKKKRETAVDAKPLPQYYPDRERQKAILNQMQYYPKPRYFSSSGSPYNKSIAAQSTSKQFKIRSTRLKTLEQDHQKGQEQPQKSRNKDMRHKNNKAKSRLLEKINRSPKQSVLNDQKNPEKQESDESFTPNGLKQENSRNGNLRSSMMKAIFPEQQHQKDILMKQQEKDRAERQEMYNHQRQLSGCLVQLTKHLKNQNEQREEIVKSKVQDRPKQQLNQIPEEGPLQQKSKQVSLHPKQKQQRQKIDGLKMKVLDALRHLNKRSSQFLVKMGGGRMSRTSKAEEGQQNPIQPNIDKSQPLKNIFKKADPKISAQTIRSPGQNSDDLVKLMMMHLSREGGHQEQLSLCLKELTQYLKHQNQELEVLKSSRVDKDLAEKLSKQKPPKYNSQPKKQKVNQRREESPIKQFEVEKQLRENESKLQTAILTRLKKAKLRSSMFSEKVENFKRQHIMVVVRKDNLSNANSKQTEVQKQQPSMPDTHPTNIQPNTSSNQPSPSQQMSKPLEVEAKPLDKPNDLPEIK